MKPLAVSARTPGLRPLQARQFNQILDRQEQDHESALHVAARTFVTSHGSLAMGSPICPPHQAILVVLSRHRITLPDGTSGYSAYFRAFRPLVDHVHAVVHWDQRSAIFGYDLNVPIHVGGTVEHHDLGPGGSLPSAVVARLGMDMDRACQRSAWRDLLFTGVPVMPVLLASFPKGADIQPVRTPFVEAHAVNAHMSWQDAWHALRQALRLPQPLHPGGCEVIDARLLRTLRPCEAHPGSLSEYLDMRDVLGRIVYNPARHLDPHLAGRARNEPNAMRQRLIPEYREAATNADLRAAADSPCDPLILSRAAAIQVWIPPHHGMRPESFQFREPGIEADLWHVAPQWMDALGLPMIPGTHRLTVPRVVCRQMVQGDPKSESAVA